MEYGNGADSHCSHPKWNADAGDCEPRAGILLAVGVLVNSDPEAKIAMFRTVIDRSKPMSSMDALAELTPDHAAFASGSCRVTLSDPGSVGLLVQAPAGTKIAITFNGVQYSSSILSTAFMIQDGAIRPGALESGGALPAQKCTRKIFSAVGLPQAQRRTVRLRGAGARSPREIRRRLSYTACCGRAHYSLSGPHHRRIWFGS